METLKSKLAWLFLLHPIAITAHNINEMLPLFFGGSIAIPGGDGIASDFVQWATVTQYIVPVVMILLMILSSHVAVRIFAVLVALITLLPNSMHFAQHMLGEASSANRATLAVVEVNLILQMIFAVQWLRKGDA